MQATEEPRPRVAVTPDRLLIIDDERDNCELICSIGEANGYSSSHATSANDCFERLSGEEPTLIFIDLQLGGMDGIELLRNLADAGCRASIAIMSDLDRRVLESAGRLARCLKLDLLGILQKPVASEELTQIMRSAAARRAN
jgi:CheY-like chemotaxis protein